MDGLGQYVRPIFRVGSSLGKSKCVTIILRPSSAMNTSTHVLLVVGLRPRTTRVLNMSPPHGEPSWLSAEMGDKIPT